MNTASELIQCIWRDTWPSLATLADYGFLNIDSENRETLYQLYAGIVKVQGINPQFLHQVFLANRLDELIHKRYAKWQSGYYEDFLQKPFSIGKTRLLPFDDKTEEELKQLEILDIDVCHACRRSGLLKRMCYPANCANCLIITCEDCMLEHGYELVCRKCKNVKLKQRFNKNN